MGGLFFEVEHFAFCLKGKAASLGHEIGVFVPNV